MASPWPPSRDLDLRTSSLDFSAKVAVDPEAIGVRPDQSAELSAAAAAFAAAMTVVSAPSLRTSTAVITKNEARKSLLKIMRQVGRQIANDARVTRDVLGRLGMVVPDDIKTPIPRPPSQPVVMVTRYQKLRHTVRVANADTPSRRALPRGAVGYAVFTSVHAIGEKPPELLADWRFQGIGTRLEYETEYRPGESGQQSSIVVRFLNRKGALGPASSPVTCMIA
jgi:hypothetical protein